MGRRIGLRSIGGHKSYTPIADFQGGCCDILDMSHSGSVQLADWLQLHSRNLKVIRWATGWVP